MNSGGFLFIGPLYDLVFNVLIVLYRFFGENLGLALIALAIVSRLVVLPFTLKQIKNIDKNKEFQKKYEAIKKKYKSNKEVQAQELAKLQAQYLPGQLSGCLTLILQLLLLIQINYVIHNLLKYGAAAFNEIAYGTVGKLSAGHEISLNFLGINLGKSASNVGVTNFEKSWPYLLIALVLVVSQYYSMKLFTNTTPKKEESAKKKKADPNETPSFSEVFQDTNRQMMVFFPVLIGFFSLNYSSGLSLYFATTSLFVIIQQGIMKRKELTEKFRSRFLKIKVSEKSEEKQSAKVDKTEPKANLNLKKKAKHGKHKASRKSSRKNKRTH